GDALDHMHNLRDRWGTPLGIAHRDVSTSNIIISNAGIVKLIDFGIAKATDITDSRVHGQPKDRIEHLIEPGLLKGKLDHLAPEYPHGEIDARADLFSVGVIAYELLSNRPLFPGCKELDTLTRLREMTIPSLSQRNQHVSPDLDNVVLTALHRDPGERWQTAAELKAALSDVAHSMRSQIEPP